MRRLSELANRRDDALSRGRWDAQRGAGNHDSRHERLIDARETRHVDKGRSSGSYRVVRGFTQGAPLHVRLRYLRSGTKLRATQTSPGSLDRLSPRASLSRSTQASSHGAAESGRHPALCDRISEPAVGGHHRCLSATMPPAPMVEIPRRCSMGMLIRVLSKISKSELIKQAPPSHRTHTLYRPGSSSVLLA